MELPAVASRARDVLTCRPAEGKGDAEKAVPGGYPHDPVIRFIQNIVSVCSLANSGSSSWPAGASIGAIERPGKP